MKIHINDFICFVDYCDFCAERMYENFFIIISSIFWSFYSFISQLKCSPNKINTQIKKALSRDLEFNWTLAIHIDHCSRWSCFWRYKIFSELLYFKQSICFINWFWISHSYFILTMSNSNVHILKSKRKYLCVGSVYWFSTLLIQCFRYWLKYSLNEYKER